MARYEVTEAKSQKFWEITLVGKTCWGRHGQRGDRDRNDVMVLGDWLEQRPR